jgi:leader peptidase (prepilin peptidase)/N-methyltransferase
MLLLFVLGSYLGRFANRCAVRLPQKFYLGESFRHLLAIYPLPFPGLYGKWYQLLPIVGTTFLPGWSPFSGRHVRQREPWIELFNGLLLVGLYCVVVPVSMKYGQSGLFSSYMPITVLSPEQVSPVYLGFRYLFLLVLVEALLIATLIDFDLYIIPDSVTFPPMMLGMLGALTGLPLFLVPIWFQDPASMNLISNFVPENMWFLLEGPAVPSWITAYPWLHCVANSFAGFVIGGGSIWVVRIIGYMVLKQEAMGFGDVVLMAMVGIFLGWQPVIVAIFLGALCASVIAISLIIIQIILNLETLVVIPFGPYLSLGTYLLIFCWGSIWPSAEHYFDLGIIAPLFLLSMAILLYVSLHSWLRSCHCRGRNLLATIIVIGLSLHSSW